MNKFLLSFASIIVGFILGVIVAYTFLEHREQTVRAPEIQSFYYRLDDSTIGRHTIRGQDSVLQHTIDTIRLLPPVR